MQVELVCAVHILGKPSQFLVKQVCMHSHWANTTSPPLRASDKCQREKRKTINGDDLVWAMGILGFEEYGEPLKLYLHKYREVSAPAAALQSC